MPIDVLMPALSPTMEKGNLAKWLKKEGDAVRSGDVLAEIETDKATMEVEAVNEGVLARIVVPEGTTDVPVNDLIALIAAEGEDPNAVEAQAAGGATAAIEPASRPDTNAAPGGGFFADARVDAAPDGIKANGASPPPATGMRKSGRPFSSPLARRVAELEKVDLSAVTGSGPHGRIIARDVRAAIAAGSARSETVAAATPAAKASEGALAPGLASDQVKALFEPGSYEEIPLDGMRKTIAKRLVESKQTVPHFYLSADCELDALLSLREQANAGAGLDADGKPIFKLSVNDFVIKALAVALQRVPDANAVFAEDRILKFRHSDIGVAVAVEGGLFTPVIRRAETKSLSAISAEMRDLAARARARKLRPEEYSGGASAVSNLGMYGIKHFSAVINPPHSTILAVGGGEARVVARGGAPAVVQAMTVTLSVDHRAIDGALGAELLAAFKALIENPIGMLV